MVGGERPSDPSVECCESETDVDVDDETALKTSHSRNRHRSEKDEKYSALSLLKKLRS